MACKHHSTRRAPLIEELEPRILYSADPFVLSPLTVDGADGSVVTTAVTPPLTTADDPSTDSSTTAVAAPLREVIFVDTAIDGYEILLEELLRSLPDGRQPDIVLLDANRNGIAQIDQSLDEIGPVDAIHILSHADDGTLNIGNTRLSRENIDDHGDLLLGWRERLTPDADILIYGCNLAASRDGMALIDDIATLTGADVAASDDLTGNGADGGDWILEYHSGLIEAQALTPDDHWRGTLALTPTNERLVNTTTSGVQDTAGETRGSRNAVAMDSNGNYVVVWSDAGQDGSGYGVFAQRFDAAGNKLGGEFRVNQTTADHQYRASVAMADNGDFVVTWTSENQDGPAPSIYARRFNADGSAAGTEFRVNDAFNAQSNASIAMAGDGRFVIVWQGNGSGDSDGIYGKLFDAAGNGGSEFRINATDNGAETNPAVAMNDNGWFSVVWHSGGDLLNTLYDDSGNPQYAETVVNSSFGVTLSAHPAIALDATGISTIAWRSENFSNDGIYFNQIDSSGSKLSTSGENVSGSGDPDSTSPSISLDSTTGSFIIVYEETVSGNGKEIFAAAYASDRTLLWGPTQINQTTNNDQLNASIALLDTSNFVTVWSGEGNGDSDGVFLRQYSTNTLTVDTASDISDGDTSSITALLANKGGDGSISLREAILAANNTANGNTPDRIVFDVAGTQTITLGSALPVISDAVVIDGTTDPDFAGSPVIQLDGSGLGATTDGLNVSAGGSTIRGLVITGFGGDGIDLNGNGNNLVEGNYIGVGTDGATVAGNGTGIRISAGSANNTIGGTSTGSRNIVSGNSAYGILIQDSGSTGNTIIGNYIGTNANGDTGLSGSATGLRIFGADNNTIGGTTAASRNLISGNAFGVSLYDADGNSVQGNYIGTDASGLLNAGNTNSGIIIQGTSVNNTIGGTGTGEANIIANNNGSGVLLASTVVDNTIRGNSIYGNTGLAIDLNGDGSANPNDTGDTDSGANNLQNAPVLTSATLPTTTDLRIQGSFNSAANTTYTLDYYENSMAGSSTYSEARRYLGSSIITTDGSGNQTIDTLLTGVNVGNGSHIAVTATDPAGNTSELSGSVPVTRVPSAVIATLAPIDEGASVTLDGSGSSDPDGDSLSYAWDLDNDGTYGDVTGINPTVDWATLKNHGIDDDGSYTIGLQVDDGNGGVATTTAVLTVNNVAPTLTVSGDPQAWAGVSYTLNLAATDPGNDTITGWTINWGDGQIETLSGNPASASHVYSNTGFTNNILVSATDEDNAAGYLHNDLFAGHYSPNSGVYRIQGSWGNPPAEFANEGALDKAIQPVVGPDGKLYVSGEASKNVLRYDPTTGAYIDTFATLSGKAGGLAFGPDGNLYVANYSARTIERFDPATGNALGSFVTGIGDNPYGLTFGPDGNLYVGLYNAAEIVKFDGKTGAALGAFVTSGAGGLGTPEQIIFGPDGHLYVADVTNNSVLKFDGGTGAYLGDFIAASEPNLDQPNGLAFGADGHLYVSDASNGDILRYDGRTGAFIDTYASGLYKPSLLGFLPDLQVKVVSENTAPTLTASANDPTFTEGGTAPTLFSSTAVSTVENGQTIEQLVLTVGNLNDGNDEIITIDGSDVAMVDGSGTTVNSGFGYSVSLANGTASLTLTTSGSSTGAVETLIDALRYRNDSDDPTPGDRVVTITSLKDSGGTANGGSDTATLAVASTVTVAAINDAPLLSGIETTALASTENDAATAVSATISVGDVDNATVDSAIIKITSNYQNGEDLLAFADTANITGTWDAATGTLTLSGSDTLANYQAALRSVTYANSSENPSTLTRTISFTVNDGGLDSNTATRDVAVTAVNDAPVITTNTGATFQEASSGNAITSSMLSASDVDDSATGLTYTITALPANGTLKLSGTALALNGTFTQDDIDHGRLRYDHNGSQTTSDVFSFTLADGGEDGVGTVSATFDITIDAINQFSISPISDIDDFPDEVVENQPAGTVVGITVQATDVDGTDTVSYELIDSANQRFSLIPQTGEIVTATSLDAEQASSYTITVRATSTDGSFTTKDFTIRILDIDDNPPVITAATNISATEDRSQPLSIHTEADRTDDVMSFEMSVTNGILTFTAANGTTIVDGGSGQASATLSGTADAINATLETLGYRGAANFHGEETLRLIATDETGQRTQHDILIDVAPTNDPPAIFANTTQLTADHRAIAPIQAGGLSIEDVDAADGQLTLTLQVGSGRLHVESGGSGVSIGGGNDSQTVTLTGTLSQLNALLAGTANGDGGITWLGSLDDTVRSITVQVTVDDLGNTGGGPLTDTLEFTIEVPARKTNAPITIDEDGAPVTLSLATLFGIDDTSGMTFSLENPSAGSPIETTIANGALTITPLPDQHGTTTLTLVAHTAEGTTLETSIDVIVQSIPDAPQVKATPIEGSPDNALRVEITLSDADRNAAGPEPDIQFFFVSDINGGRLFLSDGTTPVPDGSFVSRQEAEAGLIFIPENGTDTASSLRFSVLGAFNDRGLPPGAERQTVEFSIQPPTVDQTPPPERPAIEEVPSAEETGAQEDENSDNGTLLLQHAIEDSQQERSRGEAQPVIAPLLFDIDPVTPPEHEIRTIDDFSVLGNGDDRRTVEHTEFAQLLTRYLDEIERQRDLLIVNSYEHLFDSLEKIRQQIDGLGLSDRTIVGTAVVASAGLSAGYVVWMLRSGLLISSMMFSAPAWSIADPLSILNARRDDEDDESLEDIVTKGARRRTPSSA